MPNNIAIHVNGEASEVPNGTTVADLLKNLQITAKRIAVEVNEEILPRSQYADTALQDADQIEIVQAIGGG